MKKIRIREGRYTLSLFFTKYTKKHLMLFFFCSFIALSLCSTVYGASYSTDDMLEEIQRLNPHITIFSSSSIECRFRQRDYLGGGTNGAVYRGTLLLQPENNNSSSTTDVALKEVDLTKAANNHRAIGGYDFDNNDLLEALCFEVDNLFQCHHRNIVKFYGLVVLGTPDEHGHIVQRLHIVTKLYQINLQKYLENDMQRPLEQRLSHEQRLRLAIDITRGLSYLHRNELIHRDLKADNIFIDERGAAVIGDLGVANSRDCPNKLVRKGNQSRKVKAPESVVDWNHSDTSTDIWALGRLFVQLITDQEENQTTWGWMKRNILDVSEVDSSWMKNGVSFTNRQVQELRRLKREKPNDAHHPLKKLHDHNGDKEIQKRLKKKLLELIRNTTQVKGGEHLSSFSPQLSRFKELTENCLSNDPESRPTIEEIITQLQGVYTDIAPDVVLSSDEEGRQILYYGTLSQISDDRRKAKKCTTKARVFLEQNRRALKKAMQFLTIEEGTTATEAARIIRWVAEQEDDEENPIFKKSLQYITMPDSLKRESGVHGALQSFTLERFPEFYRRNN